MTGTINNKIPFVPENTIDPAAGLNLSLNTIDALLQVLVQTVGANTPPAGVEGQRFIVGTAPTGAWAGQANKLARFLGGAWRFFDARYVLNAADGLWYVRQSSTWSALAGGAPTWGSITGTLSAQADLALALGGKQGNSENLTALSGLTGAADRLPYFTGVGALSLATLTGLARDLLDDTTQSGMQSTLGLVKQTSAIDTTTGALMAVGAFGLGGTDLPLLGSLDDRLTRPGLYACVEITGAPSQYGIVHIVSRATGSSTSAWVHQVFYDAVNNGAVYERYSTNLMAWSPWRLMYHTGNILGTVSQSGGIPTGAIIERGSNANGEYVRWADGTLEVTKVLTGTFNASTPYGSVFISSLFSGGPMAAASVSAPAVTITVETSTSTSYMIEGVSSTSSFPGLYIAAFVPLSGTYRASLTSKGRWF